MSICRSVSGKAGTVMRVLAVFDFDHTVIEENSDVLIRNNLPKEILHGKKLKELRTLSWTAYMAEIFKLLPSHGITKEVLITSCEKLVPCQGMTELFEFLRSIKADIMILSDANSVIIQSWLSKNLPGMEIEVVTNNACWSKGGYLIVTPFQNQRDCRKCPSNLCKGSVLLSTRSRHDYDFVMYTGDGKNDLCPALKLKRGDLLFPRKEYALERLVRTNKIEASVLLWSNACEIKERLVRKIRTFNKIREANS